MELTRSFGRLLLLPHVRAQCYRSASSQPVELAFNKYDKGVVASESRSPIVILHGLFGHKQNWHSVAKALNRRLKTTVFAVDLRNHGDSPWTDTMSYVEMAEDVERFLKYTVPREMNVETTKIHLLGHSMGGKTAIKIALSPEGHKLLDSLVVEDMVPKKYETANHRRFPEYLQAMKNANLMQTRFQISSQLRRAIPDLTVRQFLLTSLTGKNGALRWRMNLGTLEKYLDSMCDVDKPEGQFDGKTMFISGEKSPYVTPGDHSLILRLFPKTKFAIVRGAGHWVHAERPYDFMDKVANFIQDA